MARTTLRGSQITDATVQRADLDTATDGQAVIAKIVQGTGISISSTGGNSGTGDVTVNVVSAPIWTTARNLAGNSVDGSDDVAFANKFIIQGTSDAGLSSSQFLGALGTGIVKNTTTTGVLSIAVAGDFPTLNQNTTGTATTATNSTITDDTTTNSTMYPTWVTTASGSGPLKVSSTKMSFNPSTGALAVGGTIAIGTGTALAQLHVNGAGTMRLSTDVTNYYVATMIAGAIHFNVVSGISGGAEYVFNGSYGLQIPTQEYGGWLNSDFAATQGGVQEALNLVTSINIDRLNATTGVVVKTTSDDTVASASTVDLTGLGPQVDITGTTTITAITLPEGEKVIVRFTGALTLTNGANLQLPNGDNIITAANDWAIIRGKAAGVVVVSKYFPDGFLIRYGGDFSTGGIFRTNASFSTVGVFSTNGDFNTSGSFTTGGTFNTFGTFSVGSGDFSVAGDFSKEGNHATTITTTGTTNSTLPAGTHTLAALEGNTFTGQNVMSPGGTGEDTAPIKLVSGSLNIIPEAGAIEFLADVLYFTKTTGPTRMSFVLGSSAGPLTVAGPTAARTMTVPDANFAAARTDDAQTFTGIHSFPTTPADTNTTQVATTAFVIGQGYLKAATAASTYQPLDADLTALAALTGTNTIYYRSAANTWSAVTIGTNLAFAGGTLDATGGGSVATDTIFNDLGDLAVGTGPDTAAVLTVGGDKTFLIADSSEPTGIKWKGAVDARADLSLVIGLDVQAYDADLTALAALTGTNTIYYRSAANTWTPVTIGANLTFGTGTLAATGGGSVATDVIFDALGDLVVGTGADTAAVLSVGADNAFLVPDALEATGLKWIVAADARAVLNLIIGTTVQAFSANLDEYAAVNPTAAGLALLDDADAPAQRTTLGLVIGTNVQAYDADLTSWAAITRAAGFDTFATTPTSANLKTVVTDETGSGSLVFATSPVLVTPNIGVANGTSITVTTGYFTETAAEYPLQVLNTGISANQGIGSFLASSLSDGNSVFFVLGKAITATNCSTFSFTRNATDANTRWSVGFYAQDNRFNVFTDGGATLGNPGATTSPGAGTLVVSGSIGIGTTPTARLLLPAGTATASTAPLKFTSGTSLTAAEAGVFEYDGTAFFQTTSTTNGRAQNCDQQIFRLTANGSAIGATIADYFGANSSIPTVTNGVYEITFYLNYLKSTAGTVTYTLTNTQTYTNLVANWRQTPVGGLGTAGTTGTAGIVTTTTAAAALPATASLTTAVNHQCIIQAIAECGTAGNIRLRVTESAGTITPLRGSYYTVRRLFAGNVGTFAA